MKKGVDFFHNLNFVFKNGLDQVFKGAEIVAPSYGVQFKRSTEIKSRALKLLHLSKQCFGTDYCYKEGGYFYKSYNH